jgi:hypothetical protein
MPLSLKSWASVLVGARPTTCQPAVAAISLMTARVCVLQVPALPVMTARRSGPRACCRAACCSVERPRAFPTSWRDHVRAENALATPCQPSGCRHGKPLFLPDGCDGVADLALLVAQQQEIVPAPRAGDNGLDRFWACGPGQPFGAAAEIRVCYIRLCAQQMVEQLLRLDALRRDGRFGGLLLIKGKGALLLQLPRLIDRRKRKILKIGEACADGGRRDLVEPLGYAVNAARDIDGDKIPLVAAGQQIAFFLDCGLEGAAAIGVRPGLLHLLPDLFGRNFSATGLLELVEGRRPGWTLAAVPVDMGAWCQLMAELALEPPGNALVIAVVVAVMNRPGARDVDARPDDVNMFAALLYMAHDHPRLPREAELLL